MDRKLFEYALAGDWQGVMDMVNYDSQDFFTRDPDGQTVLHYAVRSGNASLAEFLIRRLNMDPLSADKNGCTPYDLALQGAEDMINVFVSCTGIPAGALVHNPVQRGFFPDPSWIKVGDTYYMVNSSFVFYPCIPISRSRDLVHWTVCGHAITEPEWTGISDSDGGRGYWAPDISYDPEGGRYWITATLRGNENAAEKRVQMVVSSTSPEGPYDKPRFIHEDGIDPSLYHENGRHFMLLNRSVRMLELDEDCRNVISGPHFLWGGDRKVKTEGPQMMKKDGYYYILAAEGGTGSGHRISAARSGSLEGPYENCPYNPILRQDDPDGYLQNTGHGKLLQAENGRWYVCYLCLRKTADGMAPMGRETAIDEVVWTMDGWPVIKNRRRPSDAFERPLPEKLLPETALTQNGWLTPRVPGHFTEADDRICLFGNGQRLYEKSCGGVLLKRQTENDFSVQVVPDTAAATAAGLCCYYDEHSYLQFGLSRTEDDGLRLVFREYAGDTFRSEKTARPDGLSEDSRVTLRICAENGERHFYYRYGTEADGWTLFHSIREPDYLTSEAFSYGKRFTGAMIGLYNEGDAPVTFCGWELKQG